MWRGWGNIRSPAQCTGRRSLVPAWATASPADPTHRPAANPGWRSAEGYEAVACSSCLGLRGYATHPPFDAAVSAADLVAGLLVGVADKTIQWLQTLVALPGPRCISLVVVVFPAGPTREEHLITLKMLQAQITGPEQELDIRLLPIPRAFGPDYERMILPPTVLQAHESSTSKTTLCIGSIGDSGRDTVGLSSFNVVFQADDALRDAWCRWFQYLFASAVPLTTDTVRIPHESM